MVAEPIFASCLFLRLLIDFLERDAISSRNLERIQSQLVRAEPRCAVYC